MMIIIIIAIVVLAVILGIGRSLLGDILHIVSALVAAVAAFKFVPVLSGKINGIVIPLLSGKIAVNSYIKSILETILNPLSYALVFIGAFTAVGVVTHVIAGFFKRGEKRYWIPKIIINVIAGLLIAYVVSSPFGYYSSIAPKVAEVASDIGMNITDAADTVGKFGLNGKIYAPITDRLTMVNYGNSTFTVEEGLGAFAEFKDILPLIINSTYHNELISQIQDDQQKDMIYGCIAQSMADKITEKRIRDAALMDGKLSSKIKALIVMDEVGNLIKDTPKNNLVRFKLMLENADKESYDIAASLIDFDFIRMEQVFVRFNLPLIIQLVKEIGNLEDRSAERIAYEAEALNYIFTAPNKLSHPFDFNKLDPEDTADYIHGSIILKNAYINMTNGGEILNPCDLKGRHYEVTGESVIRRLKSAHGYSDDDPLVKSLKSYFGVSMEN